MQLDSQGIATTLPPGWEGRITRREAPAAAPALGLAPSRVTLGPSGATGERTFPIAHLANFALPEERGDFGSGAVELMGDHDVFVVLFEYDPESATTALFAPKGIPRALTASAFDPAFLRRGIQGQTGFQTFFHEGGRAFSLYVVLGSAARRNALVKLVNAVLPTVRITPRPAG